MTSLKSTKYLINTAQYDAYNFAGQPGARMFLEDSVRKKEQHMFEPFGLFHPFLFNLPHANMRILNGIWNNYIIQKSNWLEVADKFVNEWQLVVVNVSVVLAPASSH